MEGQDEALTANTTKKKKKLKKDVESFNCGNKGHYKSNCWVKGGGKEGQGQKRKGKDKDSAASAEQLQPQPDIEAWAAIEEVSEEDQSQQSFASELCTKSELYDSGTSCHMSPFCSQSISFCLIPPHPILTANK